MSSHSSAGKKETSDRDPGCTHTHEEEEGNQGLMMAVYLYFSEGKKEIITSVHIACVRACTLSERKKECECKVRREEEEFPNLFQEERSEM